MSMPIQRQSESFGIFDDGPRYDRDRPSHDLPRGLAGLVNGMGPRIQAGLLNTRLAVNVDGMDPDDHAYHTEAPYGPGGDWVGDEDGHRSPRREWNPDYGYEPTDEDERRAEGVYDDDESGYNWGPVPPEHLGAVAEDYSGGDEDDPDWVRENSPRQQEWNRNRREDGALSSEIMGLNPWRGDWQGQMSHVTGSRHPFDRAAARRLAEHDDLPPLPDDFRVPDSPEGQPDRSPGWLYRQFTGPHKSVWDIPEHELNDRWNGVYDALGFDSKTRQNWEKSRHTDNPSDKWDGGMDGMLGGGVKDYLTRAPMSKDEYARHREHSQNRAKELSDGLWNAMYPPEEEEGRRAVENVDTVNNLIANGWQPDQIKYDEDDRPYGFYQHPSGWNVSDHGGNYKEIGHAATPGKSHDVINVTRHDRETGTSHNAPFGPADAHNHIEEELYGDPEETGGLFQHLTENHPAIRRYRPRQAHRLAEGLDGSFYTQDPIPPEAFRHAHRTAVNQDSWLKGRVAARLNPPAPVSEGRPETSWELADPPQPTLDLGLPHEIAFGDYKVPVDRQPQKLYREIGLDLRHPDADAIRHHLYGTELEVDQSQWPENYNPPYWFVPERDHIPGMPKNKEMDVRNLTDVDVAHHILDYLSSEKPFKAPEDSLGKHWSVDPQPHGWADEDQFGLGKYLLPVRLTADWMGFDEDFNRTDTGGENEGEQEITLLPGAPVKITQVHFRHPQTGEWHPLLSEGYDHPTLHRHAHRTASGCTCWEGYERVPGTEPCASKSCRKKSMLQTASWFDGKPDHADAAWGETDEGWEHPVTGCRVRPSSRYLDEWEMVAPTTSKRKPYTIIDHHPDPQAMMDRHDRAAGYGPKTAQTEPTAMAPQMPAGGGFQPAHRVGLDWRDSTLRGTVIGVDDQVHVRWDDGQYTSEEPPEIRLL